MKKKEKAQEEKQRLKDIEINRIKEEQYKIR